MVHRSTLHTRWFQSAVLFFSKMFFPFHHSTFLLKLLITNITAVFIFYPAFKQLEWYWSGCPQLVRHKAEHAPETDCYFKCYTFTLITSVFPLFLFHCFRLPSFTALVLFLFFIMFFCNPVISYEGHIILFIILVSSPQSVMFLNLTDVTQ